MQDGNIVEEGTRAALYASEASVYHSLVKLQEQAMDKRLDRGMEEAQDDVVLAANPSAKQLSSKKVLDDRHKSTKYLEPDEKKEGELVRLVDL